MTLHDGYAATVPAALLALLDAQVPEGAELPAVHDDDESESGEDDEDADDDEKIELTLDASLEWEAATDIYPLLSSAHAGARRVGAYLTAIIATRPEAFADVAAPTAAVAEACLCGRCERCRQ